MLTHDINNKETNLLQPLSVLFKEASLFLNSLKTYWFFSLSLIQHLAQSTWRFHSVQLKGVARDEDVTTKTEWSWWWLCEEGNTSTPLCKYIIMEVNPLLIHNQKVFITTIVYSHPWIGIHISLLVYIAGMQTRLSSRSGRAKTRPAWPLATAMFLHSRGF